MCLKRNSFSSSRIRLFPVNFQGEQASKDFQEFFRVQGCGSGELTRPTRRDHEGRQARRIHRKERESTQNRPETFQISENLISAGYSQKEKGTGCRVLPSAAK